MPYDVYVNVYIFFFLREREREISSTAYKGTYLYNIVSLQRYIRVKTHQPMNH